MHIQTRFGLWPLTPPGSVYQYCFDRTLMSSVRWTSRQHMIEWWQWLEPRTKSNMKCCRRWTEWGKNSNRWETLYRRQNCLFFCLSSCSRIFHHMETSPLMIELNCTILADTSHLRLSCDYWGDGMIFFFKEHKQELGRLQDTIRRQEEELCNLRAERKLYVRPELENTLDRVERSIVNEINEECRRNSGILGNSPRKVNLKKYEILVEKRIRS